MLIYFKEGITLKHEVVDVKRSGQKISELINEKGLTITEVSKTLRISYESVSKWTKGITFPSADNLALLAHILDVKMQDLIVEKSH